MKNLRRILPIILIIAPYLSVFVMVLPVRKTLPLYLLFSVVIYGFNIWNAWSYPHKEDGRSLAFWDMVIKLSHIPFYAGVFAMALLLMLAMVVPAFIIVTPILVSALADTDLVYVRNQRFHEIKKRRTNLKPIRPSLYYPASVFCDGCNQRGLSVLKMPETDFSSLKGAVFFNDCLGNLKTVDRG